MANMMADMTEPVLISGFLGAGKSALAARLDCAGIATAELDGLRAATTDTARHARVITVVDCANHARHWDDPLIGPLLRRQVQAAGLIALSRTDLADPAPARAALARVTDRTSVTTAEVTDAIAGTPPSKLGPATAEDDLTAAFDTWSYRGPVRLAAARAESLAEHRPEGTVRLKGQVRTDKGGLEIEVAGQVRQVRAVPAPAETSLVAFGPRTEFSTQTLDLWFAEAVSDSSHGLGIFSYR